MTRQPGPTSRPNRTMWWISLLAVLLAAAGVISGAVWVANGAGRIVADPAPRPAAALPRAAATDGTDDVEQLRIDVEKVLAQYAADPRLGDLAGMVTDVESGELLWQHNPDKPQRPASATKILTAAAALWTLPLDHRLRTTLHEGDAGAGAAGAAGADEVGKATPGTIVLRGGGDVTLAQTGKNADAPGWHEDAATLEDLASQLKDPGAVKRIVVDTSAWDGDTFIKEWDKDDIDGGYIAPMEPVMVDGARKNHEGDDPQRSHNPAFDAGTKLAEEIAKQAKKQAEKQAEEHDGAAGAQASDIEVTVSGQKTGGAEIASVQSATLRTRLHDMMSNSDNVLAEAIGREVAAAHQPDAAPTPESTVEAMMAILQEHGVPLDGVDVHDSSGMAMANLIPSRTLADIIVRSARDGGAAETSEGGKAAEAEPQNEDSKLRPLVETMSVAGGAGTLAGRFDGQEGAGFVRGKTGTLTGTSALAGVTTTSGGDVLAFVLVSNDVDVPAAREAQDELTSALTKIK